MKLRNKKTGKIWEFDGVKVLKNSDCTIAQFSYDTLAELNENWEDYEPKEPAIEDENKLDTVKSFFALLGITKEIYYQSVNNCFYHTDDDGITYAIDFDDDNGIENLCTGLPYTIAELCGEEE